MIFDLEIYILYLQERFVTVRLLQIEQYLTPKTMSFFSISALLIRFSRNIYLCITQGVCSCALSSLHSPFLDHKALRRVPNASALSCDYSLSPHPLHAQ